MKRKIQVQYRRPSPRDFKNMVRLRSDRQRLHLDVSLEYIFMREIEEWPGVNIEWTVNSVTSEASVLLTPCEKEERAYLYKWKNKKRYVAVPVDAVGRAKKFTWTRVDVNREDNGFRIHVNISWTHLKTDPVKIVQ